jgi:hypothetical protein
MKRSNLEDADMSIPTADEFRTKFIGIFNECCEQARRDSFDEAWANWTAFMTGEKKQVMEQTSDSPNGR